MDNEQEKGTPENPEEDLDLELEEKGEKEEKTEKPKKEYTTEQKLARVERMREKYLKELGLDKSKPESKKEEKATKSELDYGQLAFHNSKSGAIKIESEEDVEFLKQTIEETGKPMSAILNSKWFNAELKERQELKNTSDKTPKNVKRTGASGRDEAEYWLEKINSGSAKLSDIPDRATQIKVVELKRKRAGGDAEWFKADTVQKS